MLKHLFALTFLCLISVTLAGQPVLPTIKPEDCEKWQTLESFSISDDGIWVSWKITLGNGDDSLYIKNPVSSKLYKYASSSDPVFSTDSKWVAFNVGYSKKQVEKMNNEKEPVQNNIKLIDLTTGRERLFGNISSFSFANEANHLIMSGYSSQESKTKDLFIYNLKTGTIKNISNVSEYSVNKPGNRLAYIISAENKKGNGVELMNLDNYVNTFVDNDTCIYRNLVWEKEGNSLAFLKEITDTVFMDQNHMLFTYRNIYSKPEIKSYNPASDKSFPIKMRISENYQLSISRDQKTLFFGVSDCAEKGAKDLKPSKVEELPSVDVWHWKDDPIQPSQKKTFETDKDFTYLFAWSPDQKKAIRITDEELRQAYPTSDGHFAIATNDNPYKPAFRDPFYDYYVVNTATGQKLLFLENFTNKVYCSSPDGKYALYFKDKNWWVYDILNDKHINLTKDIPSAFWNTRDDHTRNIKPPFGFGGFFKDDKAVILYDEYDIWKVYPYGAKPLRLTNGKESNIIFRNVRINYEYIYNDPDKDLYFSAFGDLDKKMGYYRFTVNNKLEKLIFADKGISGFVKAKKSDFFLYSSETFSSSPNVYRASKTSSDVLKISDTNPQQSQFAWGKSQLINFRNTDEKPLQGALFYPVNYEPGKKYPMIVSIYEIKSNELNLYITPSSSCSYNPYNITNYTSQGYFIFQPDIVYNINHPGESAVNCIVPAVKEVLKTDMIDEKRLGIMGHSWGGYQTCFIVSQTNLFSAAVAGAPLTDLISMYNGIFWNDGSPNQSNFETHQGRISEPWWKNLQDYMANSPMFQAQKIETPLLVAFGNADGAVDWHQGIEMYITMRRMGKPFIMLEYDGENHKLARKENQMDYTKKVNDFFNYYLLGKEAAGWLTKGKTYLEKKKEEKMMGKNNPEN